jgi:hypothetical protein
MLLPVSLLPNEILSAIFEAGHCQSSSEIINNWEPPFEMTVSQVTAHWQDVALSLQIQSAASGFASRDEKS